MRYVVLDSDTGILYKNQPESLNVSLLIPIPYILNRKAFLNKTLIKHNLCAFALLADGLPYAMDLPLHFIIGKT